MWVGVIVAKNVIVWSMSLLNIELKDVANNRNGEG